MYVLIIRLCARSLHLGHSVRVSGLGAVDKHGSRFFFSVASFFGSFMSYQLAIITAAIAGPHIVKASNPIIAKSIAISVVL